MADYHKFDPAPEGTPVAGFVHLHVHSDYSLLDSSLTPSSFNKVSMSFRSSWFCSSCASCCISEIETKDSTQPSANQRVNLFVAAAAKFLDESTKRTLLCFIFEDRFPDKEIIL